MKIKIMRLSRGNKTLCDKFTDWMDADGVERQGFLHDMGVDVLVGGLGWVPQYQYEDGSVWPEIQVRRANA